VEKWALALVPIPRVQWLKPFAAAAYFAELKPGASTAENISLYSHQ